MTTEAEPKLMRYPLGLPAGSVRSLISLMIVGLLCAIILISTKEKPIPIPPYLIGLLILVSIGLFGAHGRSMNKHRREKGPLGLPRWTVRLFLVAALIATVAYKMSQALPDLEEQLKETFLTNSQNPLAPFYILLSILGGNLIGHFAQVVFGMDRQPAIYQDFIAWVSLLAIAGMAIDILVTLVINPNLRSQSPVDLSVFEAVLAGIIGFYFAARS